MTDEPLNFLELNCIMQMNDNSITRAKLIETNQTSHENPPESKMFNVEFYPKKSLLYDIAGLDPSTALSNILIENTILEHHKYLIKDEFGRYIRQKYMFIGIPIIIYEQICTSVSTQDSGKRFRVSGRFRRSTTHVWYEPKESEVPCCIFDETDRINRNLLPMDRFIQDLSSNIMGYGKFNVDGIQDGKDKLHLEFNLIKFQVKNLTDLQSGIVDYDKFSPDRSLFKKLNDKGCIAK